MAASASIARSGTCGVTADDIEGDCEAGDRGSFTLNRSSALEWDLAHAACSRRCALCSQCRYFSYSLRFADCSWFASCEFDRLNSRPRGLRTGTAAAQLTAPR
eukprot:2301138-Prymnesium_polylepis.1